MQTTVSERSKFTLVKCDYLRWILTCSFIIIETISILDAFAIFKTI